jgi:DsbC/DsbD-like thiol-disulfide interchange protein
MERFMNALKLTRRSLVWSGVSAVLVKASAMASERHYRLRLIAGEPMGDILRAGIDIELAPGWKTYWRMPGDAGVPPQFDWSGSTNLQAVDLLWPAPGRFTDLGGETVGYKDRVVFPLRITPMQRGGAVALKLAIFFAVCKDICIPADARAELASWQGDPMAEALLTSFEGRVPVKTKESSPLYVSRASAALADGKLELVLAFAAPPPSDLDIFVESKDSSYFHAGRRSGTDTYRLPVEGAPDPQRLKGSTLKLTLVGQNLALEQDVIVD